MDLLSGIIKAFSFPEVVSQDGGQIDGLVIAVHLLMLVLFVGWIIYYFIALWKFRATNNPTADYKGVKSKTITNSIEGAIITAKEGEPRWPIVSHPAIDVAGLTGVKSVLELGFPPVQPLLVFLCLESLDPAAQVIHGRRELWCFRERAPSPLVFLVEGLVRA